MFSKDWKLGREGQATHMGSQTKHCICVESHIAWVETLQKYGFPLQRYGKQLIQRCESKIRRHYNYRCCSTTTYNNNVTVATCAHRIPNYHNTIKHSQLHVLGNNKKKIL